jgi:hypothetical protein
LENSNPFLGYQIRLVPNLKSERKNNHSNNYNFIGNTVDCANTSKLDRLNNVKKARSPKVLPTFLEKP